MSERGQFFCDVISNTPLCRDHYRLVLRLSFFPPTYPGQFLQIACRDWSVDYSALDEHAWLPQLPPDLTAPELLSQLAILRRPFSLAGRVDGPKGVDVHIIYRTLGVATRWMSRLSAGDSLSILGPLCNHFAPPPDDGIAILVGGGVGIPPILYLAAILAGRKAVAFMGAVERDLLPLTVTADAPAPAADSVEPLHNILEFSRHGIPAVITTDNGSYGFRGLITDALERYLDRYFDTRNTPASVLKNAVVYTCGPEPMMKRVAQMAIDHGIACQVSVERAMACGMGTCQSCCIRVRKPDPAQPPLAGQEWAYRLACTDGPIFQGADLMW